MRHFHMIADGGRARASIARAVRGRRPDPAGAEAMRRGPAVLAALAAPAARAQEEAPVPPSGQALDLAEVLVEEQPFTGETLVVVRILAPAIGTGEVDADAALADLDWACETWGRPEAEALDQPVAEIVVQMMDRVVPRGVPDPAATQYFASYTLDDGLCIWEGL